MYTDGELAVHDNVVFETNTAEADGGAVGLRSSSIAHPSGGGVCFERFCEVWFDLLRQLTKPRRKGSLLSSNRVGHSFPTLSLLTAGLHEHRRRAGGARQRDV